MIQTIIMKKSFICLNILSILFLIVLCPFLYACKPTKIKMYDMQTESVLSLDFEDYIAGVTAAEIDEGFSINAIKAQSVLARTFAINFLQNSKSKYPGADISNDITEAQAYTKNIPQKIRDAVKKTKGQVLAYNLNIIKPYYCSNCGGKNSLPKDIFGINAPDCFDVVETLETQDNSKNYSWSATIEKSSILYAASTLGKNLAGVNSFAIAEKDSSGRAKSFDIAGTVLNANSFRIAVGSQIMKSCYITKIEVKENAVSFYGLGYGHGVGMSQWGANILANKNYSHEQILKYYFSKCEIVTL